MKNTKEKPGKGRMVCKICGGKGRITEDFKEYEFLTRDPATNVCLICAGTGYVGTRATLPDGRRMSDLGKSWLKGAVPPVRKLERRGIEALAGVVDEKKKVHADDADEGTTEGHGSARKGGFPQMGAEKSADYADLEEGEGTTESTERHGSDGKCRMNPAVRPVKTGVPTDGIPSLALRNDALDKGLGPIAALQDDVRRALVVEQDHPLYLELLCRIRAYERAVGGSWEPEDEARYVAALERKLGLEEVQ